MPHVVALLEVVGQRQREEGTAGDHQLHRGCQSLLHHRDVASGQVTAELVHVAEHLETIDRGN